MSEPTRRFMCLPDGTMYESARGQWVGYDVLKLATQRAEAAEAERDALRTELAKFPTLDGALLIPCKTLAVQP